MITRILDDVGALTPPVATAGVGVALTLTQVQTIVGIIAGVAGIVGTVMTIIWRHREHKRRMRE